MAYFNDAQAYIQNSMLLLSARPNTVRQTIRALHKFNADVVFQTRITTTFSTMRPKPAKVVGEESGSASAPRSMLVFKTYDPASGTTLKFRTDKASEIGRLVTGMRKCGKHMANIPEAKGGEEPEVESATAVRGYDADGGPKPGQPGSSQQGQAQHGTPKEKKKTKNKKH